MINRSMVGCVGLVLLASSGCCYFPRAFSPDRIYHPDMCEDACGAPGSACDDALPCEICGTPDCPAAHPFRALRKRATCGAGCGEIYWGEWISDPPDHCDPCDDCGGWVGPQCCVRWWERFRAGLFGQRFGGCSCAGPCDGACGAAAELYAEPGVIYEGESWAPDSWPADEYLPEASEMPGQPLPETETRPAKRQPTPAKSARYNPRIRAPYSRVTAP